MGYFTDQGGIEWGRGGLKGKRRLNKEESGIEGRPSHKY